MARILIIDDDISFVTPVKVALEEKGYEVDHAPNGQMGRELATQVHPDLIILDIMMPGEHGIAALENMRAEEGMKNTPIIVSTNLEKSLPIVKEKADGFILKSETSLDLLVSKVGEVLEKQKPN